MKKILIKLAPGWTFRDWIIWFLQYVAWMVGVVGFLMILYNEKHPPDGLQVQKIFGISMMLIGGVATLCSWIERDIENQFRPRCRYCGLLECAINAHCCGIALAKREKKARRRNAKEAETKRYREECVNNFLARREKKELRAKRKNRWLRSRLRLIDWSYGKTWQRMQQFASESKRLREEHEAWMNAYNKEQDRLRKIADDAMRESLRDKEYDGKLSVENSEVLSWSDRNYREQLRKLYGYMTTGTYGDVPSPENEAWKVLARDFHGVDRVDRHDMSHIVDRCIDSVGASYFIREEDRKRLSNGIGLLVKNRLHSPETFLADTRISSILTTIRHKERERSSILDSIVWSMRNEPGVLKEVLDDIFFRFGHLGEARRRELANDISKYKNGDDPLVQRQMREWLDSYKDRDNYIKFMPL